jgi:molybdate transport system substrate-binding protein
MKNTKQPKRSTAIAILALVASAVLGTLRAAVGDNAAKPREVVVFAAASLRETFEAIAKGFEAAHPGSHVALQLAGHERAPGRWSGRQADDLRA